MYNLKYLICLIITSALTIGVANAQNKQVNQTINPSPVNTSSNQELNNLVQQQVNNTYRSGKPLNTPEATGGSDYDSVIVSGLDDYKNRKRMIADRLAEIQRARE